MQPATNPPAWLNYEMWLGPTPWAPYVEDRVHPPSTINGRPGWLRVEEYCLGMITGWGAHHNDIAQWGMGMEYTGPVTIEAQAEFPKDGVWDVHGEFRIEYTYASGVKVICADDKKNKAGVVFEGSDGWVYVDRGKIDASRRSLLRSVIGPERDSSVSRASTTSRTSSTPCAARARADRAGRGCASLVQRVHSRAYRHETRAEAQVGPGAGAVPRTMTRRIGCSGGRCGRRGECEDLSNE